MENQTKSEILVFSAMKEQTKSEILVFSAMKEDPEQIFLGEEGDDLSYWEFINSSDSDADDVLSLSDASWHSSLSSSLKDSPIPDLNQDSEDDRNHRQDYEPFHDGYEPFHDGYGEPYLDDQKEDDCDDKYDYAEDEVDDDDDRYDLDDELVPRGLGGKFGRQRMRKLGKRAFAKMHYSKKSPYLYVKPGCVHGKHGLGLKHSC